MALLLNDDHLENLICSQCEKYLSVLPVKVYQNETIKCGRCCTPNDGGTNSLFEKIIKNCLFKCVNRYEQCNKLLTLSEVADHESKCWGGNYDCPKCDPKQFSGTSYEILRHYKKDHPASILKKNEFYVDLKVNRVKERYLYLKKDIIFFILIENLSYGESLYLSVVSLNPLQKINQQFILTFTGETVQQIKTEAKPCTCLRTFDCDYFKVEINSCFDKVKCEVFIDLSDCISGTQEIPALLNEPEKVPIKTIASQTAPLKSIVGVILTQEFKRSFPGYTLTPCGTALFKGLTRIELVCSECKNFTGSTVYSCPEKHILCWDCKKKKCKCNVSNASWNADISSVNEKLQIPCRWKCTEVVSGDNLRNHEANCLFKTYYGKSGRY